MADTRPLVPREIAREWRKAIKRYPNAARPRTLARARSVSARCEQASKEHLALWSHIHALTLDCLSALQSYIATRRPGPFQVWPAEANVGRMLSLSWAMRKLLLSGLEDSARPVARAFIESFELAVACFSDSDLANQYLDDEALDEDRFWKENIGYGKIDRPLKQTLLLAGLDEEEIGGIVELKTSFKKELSGAVHASSSSALRSVAVPSLIRPGYLVTEPLGHLSVHSPVLFSVPILFSHRLNYIAARGIMANEPLPVFQGGGKADAELETFMASMLALQEIVGRYDDQLPPPVNFPDLDAGGAPG